jgi:hypothetical protein
MGVVRDRRLDAQVSAEGVVRRRAEVCMASKTQVIGMLVGGFVLHTMVVIACGGREDPLAIAASPTCEQWAVLEMDSTFVTVPGPHVNKGNNEEAYTRVTPDGWEPFAVSSPSSSLLLRKCMR